MPLNKAKAIQGFMLISIPFLGIAFIICILQVRQDLAIIVDNFEAGTLQVTDVECVSTQTSSSAPSYCYANGFIFDKQRKVKITASLGLGYDHEVDFDRKSYEVFYRRNGKFVIANDREHDQLDKIEYRNRVLLLLLIPSLIVGSMILYYFKLNEIAN